MKKIFTLLLIIVSFNSFSQVRISQVYGGGGNASATYNRDFVELFNAGTSSADISGWSVQYASAAGTSWATTVMPAATSIGAGSYFLVALATGATGIALPTPDVSGSTNMSGTAGKVALVNVSTALVGATACSDASVVDVVGYGATASCSEVSPVVTTGIDNTKSFLRGSNGCTESNNNSVDFAVGTVNPRNSLSPTSPCSTSPFLSAGPAITGLSTTLGIASTPLSYVLSGSNLTGFPNNISITASANFEVSLTSGSGYATSISVPYTSATLASTTVYVRISSTAPQGALSGTVTNSGGGAASDAIVTLTGAVYQNFYNTKANLGLTNTGTWSSTTNGSGSSPADFTSPYQLFNIINQANANYSGVWDVSNAGNTTRIVVGDGSAAINFTILPGVDSVTSATRIDVLYNANLILQNNRRPFLNNMATGSTVEFAQTGTTSADTIRIPALSYYNLKLTNGLKYFSGNTTTVRGNLTADAVVSINGSSPTFSTINAFGNVSFINGSQFEPLPSGDGARITLAMNGSGTQNLTGNGSNSVLLFRLQRDTITSNSNINLNANLVLGNASGGGLRLNQGAATTTTLNMVSAVPGYQLSIIGAGVITPASTGKINANNGSITIAKSAGTSNAGTLRFVSGSFLTSFTMNCDPAFVRDSVIIADSLIVRGLTLTKGRVVVNAGAVLNVAPDGIIATQAFITGGSAVSFVDGKLRRDGFVDAPTASFPIGKGNKYAPVDLENGSTPGGFTMEYFFTGYGNYTIDPSTLSTYPGYNVSRNEYWVIENPTAFPLDMTFHYTDALSGILDPTQVKIAHFDGIDWNDLGGTDAGTNTTTNGTVTVTGVTTFSPFTFSARIAGVIPVKISSFTVQKLSNSVKINWTTAQEINSKEFVVERSVNGTAWAAIATIPAAGNSNSKINYTTTDNNPVKGINFYRLRQVDLDNKFDYSAVKSVLFNTSYEVLVTPNPAKDVINIYVDNSNRKINIQLVDASGKLILKLDSDQPHIQINTSTLTRGVYYVKVIDGSDVCLSKILLQ